MFDFWIYLWLSNFHFKMSSEFLGSLYNFTNYCLYKYHNPLMYKNSLRNRWVMSNRTFSNGKYWRCDASRLWCACSTAFWGINFWTPQENFYHVLDYNAGCFPENFPLKPIVCCTSLTAGKSSIKFSRRAAIQLLIDHFCFPM